MILQPALIHPRSMKAGLFGEQGSGKTLTATLIAIGLSKEYHAHAPIGFFDTEDQSDFLIDLCAAEGVPLHRVKSRAFIDMRDGLADAEASKCCAYIVDSYSHPARELEESLKTATNLVGRKLPWHHRDQVFTLWGEWVRQMRSSPLHIFLNGRLAFEWDDIDTEDGATERIKIGTKMRGDADASYEPDLLIEMSQIRDSLVRDRTTKSRRGHMKHAAVILKDRWMVMNGQTIVWKDLNDYHSGDYRHVYQSFRPHIEKLHLGGQRRVAGTETARTSASLFVTPHGESAFAERQRRVTIAIEEVQAALTTIWPGQTADEKRLKAIAQQIIFGTRSWSAVERMTPEQVETGWRVLHAFETASNGMARDEAAVIAKLTACVEAEKQRAENVSLL